VVGRIVRAVVVLVLLGVAVVAGGLAWLHFEIQRYHGPLPLLVDVLEFGSRGDVPAKLSVIETAVQPMSRAAVIDPAGDPTPQAPYVMTHPVFVLEWDDGRLLLVDAGLTRVGALRFGGPIEQFSDARPISPATSVAEALSGAASRIAAIVFTHLHIDHVDGLRELCPRIGHTVKVFMTDPQIDAWTPFTAEGRDLVAQVGCTDRIPIGGAPPIALDGFPGVAVIPVGGHTPGSLAVLAAVRQPGGGVRRYIFAGDVTNTIDAIRGDIPKPLFYRLVIVPEDDDRLGELRRYLAVLEKQHGVVVVPSHDQGHLKSLGIPPWGS
jgi:glyoxylase-like metal-dependent hydrolase (beta-lactamase superfamily II)